MLGAHEIVVDNFAGGGGASTGIEWATGRDVDPDGRALTKSEQIELAGNSVCPVVECAVVGAQLGTAPQRIAA